MVIGVGGLGSIVKLGFSRNSGIVGMTKNLFPLLANNV
jgi:hypothetical protein